MNKNADYYMEQPIGNIGVGFTKNPAFIPRNYEALQDTPIGGNVGQYFNVDEPLSKYDEDLGDINRFISQGKTVDEVRAEKQSGWDMLGNALLNNIVLAGTTAVSGSLGLVDALLEGTWNNAVNNAMADVAESTRKNFPIYRGSDYDEKPLLQKLGTGIFWADLLENLGYTEGMLIPGMGAARLLSSAPKWLATLGGSLTGAVAEASTEAINTKNDEVNGKIALANQKYNELAKYVSNDLELEALDEDYQKTLRDIDEDARRAGNFVFGSNVALLALTNSIEFSRLFTRGMGTAKRIKGSLVRKGNEYIADNTGIALAKSAGRSAVNAFSEGIEEVSQGVISNTSSNYLDYNSFNESQFNPEKRELVADLWSSTGKSLAETLHDNQTATEFASGFLIGALGVPTLRRSKIPITLNNNMFLDMRNAYNEAKDSQRLADLINTRLQDNPKINAYYNGLVRHLALQDRMNLALDKDDVYDYKTSEAAQLMSDIRMFDEAGDLDYLKEIINNSVDTSDEGISQIIENTSKDGEGPFMQNGNKMSVEDARYIIEERKQFINSKIDSYKRNKEFLESLYPNIDKETLDNAIFLKEQISDHDNRLDNIVNELLPIVNKQVNEPSDTKDSTSEEKKQTTPMTGSELKAALGNDISTSILLGALNDPRIKLSKDEKDFAKKKILDATTIGKNIEKAYEELSSILTNPTKSRENLAKSELVATAQTLKKNLSEVTTVPQFRKVLSDFGYADNTELINQLAQDEDENIASLAEDYQQITSLQKIANKRLDVLPENDTEATGIDAARQTFQMIVDEANSTDEIIDRLNEEINKAHQNVSEAKDDDSTASYEAVVAQKLQDVVNSYNEAKKAKKTESKDKKSEKKIKKDDNEPKKKRKKLSLLDVSSEEEYDDGIDEGESSGKKPNKKKHDITLDDVFDAYENKMGGNIADETKQAIRDKIESEGKDVRSALGDSELQDIYDELEAGTFDENLEDNKGNKGNKSKNKTKVDLSTLNLMSVDEAIEYLENLNSKDLSNSDLKKIKKLLEKMYEKKKAPSVHFDSDEDNSNANDNDISISNESGLRSWGAYAKYMFQDLNNRATRQAVYNSFPDAQEQLSALEELGAFDFVDRGELGKLFKAEPDIQIKYIKAKDKRLSDSILLAVEMTKDRQKRAKAIRLITGQDGKQYQVVGVLGYSNKDVVAKDNLYEINKAIAQERGKSRPEFFVSDKFYNKIKHIYSGRMVKSGEIVSRDGNISGDLEDRSLKQMLHGVKPIIGVYYNTGVPKVPALPNGADIVPLNTNNSNPREGSVWLIVQEADGRYYSKAIKVRRFNLDEYDLEEHKDSPILQQIVKDLEIICDPEANDIDRYSAKYDLQEHLLYFPEGLDILYSGDTVSIAGVDWGNNIGKGLSPQDKAQELLERLQSDDINLRFQIDTSELSDNDYVQELLDSDVMTSDLLQAHNVNASFDLYLNDVETGEPIEGSISTEDSNVGHTGNREVNTDLSGNTVNIGRTEYTILSDGRVMHKNKEITDSYIISQVKLIDNINKGLVKPMEGTNIYLGVYDDGKEFGIKKTKTSHTILEGTKLEEMKKKVKNLTDKKKRKKKLEEEASNITLDNDEGISDEELLSRVRKGVIISEDDEGLDDTDIIEDKKISPKQDSHSKSKNRGPKLIGLEFNAENKSTETTADDTLIKLSRKRAFRERIFGIVKKDGTRMFDSLDSFYKYIQDPKNGLPNVINTQEDLESILDTIENCRI